MSIDQVIAARTPDLVAAEHEKQAAIDDLFSFASNEEETMEEFTARIKAEFDAHIEETG
jgi:hypothetical protein